MKNSKNACDLKSCFMCKRCMKEWLPAIDANRKTLRVRKRELIFKEGDPVTGIFFIYQGAVKVHKQWDSEKEFILRFARKGDIVGHRGLGNDLAYPVSATALDEVTVCYINLDFFYAALKVNAHFIFELLLFYAGELNESEKNMRNLAHMPVKGRIAHALLSMHQHFGATDEGYIDFACSRQDLASFAGTTYETVFRILNELTRDGIIRVNAKEIAIINENTLQAFARQIT